MDASGSNLAGAVAAAARLLAEGSAIGLPTDTVYGLAVDPSVPMAADRVFAVKHRPRDFLLPVLVADTAQAALVAPEPSAAASALMAAFWPGPLTIVMSRAGGMLLDLGSEPAVPARTVGVRCPSHPVPRLLCATVGPLAVTSANIHGQPDATTADAVAQVFGTAVPLVLDGGECKGLPSTVVDCTGPELALLRAGPLTWGELLLVVSQ